jgi:hypothetical protein
MSHCKVLPVEEMDEEHVVVVYAIPVETPVAIQVTLFEPSNKYCLSYCLSYCKCMLHTSILCTFIFMLMVVILLPKKEKLISPETNSSHI